MRSPSNKDVRGAGNARDWGVWMCGRGQDRVVSIQVVGGGGGKKSQGPPLDGAQSCGANGRCRPVTPGAGQITKVVKLSE